MICEALVTGRIGPLTTSALPDGALTTARPATTLLLIVSTEPPRVADLARRLDSLNVEIISLRCREITG